MSTNVCFNIPLSIKNDRNEPPHVPSPCPFVCQGPFSGLRDFTVACTQPLTLDDSLSVVANPSPKQGPCARLRVMQWLGSRSFYAAH